MEANQALILRDAYASMLKGEQPVTVRVIAAIPADQGDYAPDAKSMKAVDLAWHIASSDVWFLNCIAKGEFVWEEGGRPEAMNSGEAIVAWYEQEFPPALARVEALSGDHLAKVVTFAIWTNPLVDTLGLSLRHNIHHRGQLAAYLRPMGSKVPSIYGPSADVSIEMITGTAATA